MDKSPTQIKSMFSEIAGSYDRANSVLSLGIHHLWKQKLVDQTPVKLGDAVLDCATGTGDLAILYKKKVGTFGRVVGTDFCKEMLDYAPQKALAQELNIEFSVADVTQLPFADNQFDASSISFGIRNVNNVEMALQEMSRVTRPGGHVMILEFGQIQAPGLKQAYNFYSQKVLPFVGGVVSGKPKAYQYLNDSSQAFPSGENFKDKVLKTGGYSKVEITPLSFGVAYIYKCTVGPQAHA